MIYFNELKRAEQRLKKLENTAIQNELEIKIYFRNGKIKSILVKGKIK